MQILFWKTVIDIPLNIIITCIVWSEKSPLNYFSVLQTQIVAKLLLYGWEKKENVKHVHFNTFSLLFSLFTLNPEVKKNHHSVLSVFFRKESALLLTEK